MSTPTLKILTAALLAVGLAACSTTKAPDTVPGSEQSDAAARAAAEKAAADAAKTSGAGTSTGIDSQSLTNGSSQGTANLANDVAARLGVRVFYFGYDDATLRGADLQALRAHAAYLKANNTARLTLSGHADERGTREYNMALGERRAKAVASFLTSNGARASQLEVVSYGEEKPAVAGEGEESWAKNRRVELDYTAGRP